ncbi:carboxymuconolactone decarboxylase family protein [Olleya namhaensis]|uniref:carboxymuconolactone decarboxylase family protein n=1 Tax=Olleya namhaensis TaxID=1144750 RepID=UPI00248FF1B8|nr:carboxymuconolactone decarboxylase family protein [Olleya namhaensis]
MTKDHSKKYNDLTNLMNRLGTRIPETMIAFDSLHKASINEGVLSSKTKELIALGIAITVRCDGCIAFHVHDALASGATSEEILEAIGVAVLMGGGPAVVYGCEAMEALDQYIVLERNNDNG